jgi:DinB superfamily
MEKEIPGFQATLARLLALFESVPESLVDVKPCAEDWTIKEIACHLVDSASNNHQRFTHLQRTQRLVFPTYEAEPWVALEKPRGLAWKTMLDLLRSYNAFVLHLVSNLAPACLANVWIVGDKELSLEYLARDYYRHLDWHINHLEARISEVRATQAATGR